ncbi:MAG TPA: HAMP domain-containing sensor histidine kinase [Candidatus Dormibacteraeota bacterium]|nr:HAMP domain-containing sensor histidine kinase [Candidatus Dormibacteraeota bacterium]
MAGEPTLRRRVALWMSAFALVVLTAAGAAIYLGARYVLRVTLDETLLAMARTEVASAIDRPDGQVHVHDERWVPIALPGGAGYEKYALIHDASLQVLAQTTNVAEGPPLQTEHRRETQALRGKASFGFVWRGDQQLRAVYYPLRDASGSRLAAVVAVPLQPMESALDVMLAVLAAALALGGVGAAWGASRLAARLTRPLQAIASAAQEIGDDTPDARIPDSSPDAELRVLTSVLNATLARLQAALGTQRRLVADASHELRTPLTNLRGTVEVALRRPRDAADYQRTLEECRPEIERLCRLVEELLVLSRADAGQLTVGAAPCDLTALASAAVRAYAPRATEAGVELALDAMANARVSGDADRLRGVLDNLLDNALRYAPRGTPVTVAVQRDDGHAVVSVRDRGPGLTAEEQAHVFERFYRADPARQRHSGGAGLGLAIAKVVAEAHGGQLTVASHPGAGATFSLRLPLAS